MASHFLMLYKISPPESRSHAQPRLLVCQFPIRRYCTFSSAFSSAIRLLFPFFSQNFSFPSLSFVLFLFLSPSSFPFLPQFLSFPFSFYLFFLSLSFLLSFLSSEFLPFVPSLYILSMYSIYLFYLCSCSMLSILGVSTFLFARRVGLRRPGRDDSMAGLRPVFFFIYKYMYIYT